MLNESKATLSDGTTIDELINVQTREVSMRLLSDHEIYKLEMERIFAKTWLLLGHETEIPNAGDFVVRDMGEDQVIVSRDRKGDVHVLLNVCPHRGMRVCMAEVGNAPMHRCVYHGWAFRPDGSFIGAPIEREQMHGNIFTKDQLGLRKARVQLYGGLIFATWNINGPSLEDFLGDSKFYFDLLFCRTDGGLEALGPPQRFIVPANWKAAAEQSASDGFHTLTLHRSLMETGQYGRASADDIYANAPAMYGVDISCRQGHSLRCIPAEQTFTMFMTMEELKKLSPEQRLEVLPPPGISKEMLPELKRHMSPAGLKLMAKAPPQVGGMFPNVLVLFIYAPRTDGKYSGALALHSYVPRGPDHVEFTNWIFAEKSASPEMKRDMMANAVRQAGTSGTIEQDDSDTWPHMSRNARGAIGRQQTLKYGALLGEKKPEDWPGGGYVYDGFTKDDTQWNWWLYYRELMTAKS
jgi:phenylpropionate dioxygenase-like ring-hydroxylating dioxygenase large terminal subunit